MRWTRGCDRDEVKLFSLLNWSKTIKKYPGENDDEKKNVLFNRFFLIFNFNYQ